MTKHAFWTASFQCLAKSLFLTLSIKYSATPLKKYKHQNKLNIIGSSNTQRSDTMQR